MPTDTEDRRRSNLSKFSPPTLIGKLVLAEMKRRKFSISDFCRLVGIDRYTVQRLLESDVQFTLEVIWALSINLNIDLRLLVLLARPEYATRLQKQAEQDIPKEHLDLILNLEGLSPICADAIRQLARVSSEENATA